MIKKVAIFLFVINILHATATFEEANLIHKSEGARAALPYYKELAKENNTKALHELAIIYLKGEGISKDINKAFELFSKSSALGNVDSTYLLAKMYLSKKTIYYDKIKAFNTFLEAANKNYAKAQLMIGRFFLMGEIVDKDYNKALYYFKLASKQKEYDANCYIAYMYAGGYGVFPNFGRAHVFAKDEYQKGNKLCVKVWNDYNLSKYPKDEGFGIGDYNEPVK